jgi:hypothetical protein
MAGSSSVKRASPSPGKGASDNFEDAPDHLKALLDNPKTRQIALRKIADVEFPLMDQDKSSTSTRSATTKEKWLMV